ncbi:GDSL esterase/lipase At5g45960-like [Rhododendron vialii]|uniref:GDSL esterase/lipase At5g45960-like n=1 Tax=Rhododendron vialii TaxID=182163 RepID=UPI002660485A|nr:GDSL esterase/lipase At5g45960-like [Rhododendron vialii]
MSSFPLQSLFFVLLCLLASHQCAEARYLQTSKELFCSVYTFGDSFVDPGNNDFINTPFRSNFPPYGREFPGGVSTGRFSNELLFPDILAYYVGAVNYTRPYLGPRLDLKESPTAVSFASATSGFDPYTANKTNALQLSDQLKSFQQYRARLEKAIGKKKADSQIEQAIFYVNAGSDDFALTIYPTLLQELTMSPICIRANARISSNIACIHISLSPLAKIQAKIYMLIFFQSLQRLLEQGARKIAVNGLPPLGCIPVGVTLLPQPAKNIQDKARTCIGYVNAISLDFNSMLQEELEDLQSQHPEAKIVYIDFVEPLLDVIQNPHEYGYTEVNKGCCGTGFSEIGTQCNATTSLCSDSDKFVFWDAAHPTEKTYHLIFRSNLAAIDDLIGS